jgi:hypothetical protein
MKVIISPEMPMVKSIAENMASTMFIGIKLPDRNRTNRYMGRVYVSAVNPQPRLLPKTNSHLLSGRLRK